MDTSNCQHTGTMKRRNVRRNKLLLRDWISEFHWSPTVKIKGEYGPCIKATQLLYDPNLPMLLCHGDIPSTCFASNHTTLDKLNRLAVTLITPVRRSTPVKTMEILYNLIPLHLFICYKAIASLSHNIHCKPTTWPGHSWSSSVSSPLTTVFQAEVTAIQMVAQALPHFLLPTDRFAKISTDSKATLLALHNTFVTSQLVKDTILTLNTLSQNLRCLTISWIKAHIGTGNECADELARSCNTFPISSSITLFLYL